MSDQALVFDDAKARRNAMVLAASQAIFGATSTALVVTSGSRSAEAVVLDAFLVT